MVSRQLRILLSSSGFLQCWWWQSCFLNKLWWFLTFGGSSRIVRAWFIYRYRNQVCVDRFRVFQWRHPSPIQGTYLLVWCWSLVGIVLGSMGGRKLSIPCYRCIKRGYAPCSLLLCKLRKVQRFRISIPCYPCFICKLGRVQDHHKSIRFRLVIGMECLVNRKCMWHLVFVLFAFCILHR